ncbi:hypothetical protein CPB83DRAFT_909810 [Crepidotus variabilis]|uniref:Uncharacterized protein n=1 Tax=Crepidotus variabilis TaxID=179855 RepID=A0A9P6JKW6_9AGAR|nr:hypothetical protein CPB83DRAFT_909810 [Crepidotus variabilis]
MNKFLNMYLRRLERKKPEARFAKIYYSTFQTLGQRANTLEELDSVSVAKDNDSKDDVEIAARMMRLADRYWERYCEHYGSEGTNQGQELQWQAYNILCQKLGPWHYHTKRALWHVCRWDISVVEQREILDKVVAHMEEHNQAYYQFNSSLMEAVVLCCLRNEDYSDNAKTLQLMLSRTRGLGSSTLKKFYDVYRMLFAIYLGRQEWDEAEDLIKEIRKSWQANPQQGECHAMTAEIRLRQGKLVEAEEELLTGVTLEADGHMLDGYFSCRERLMEFYLQQEKWILAEDLGRHLVQVREDQISEKVRPRSKSSQDLEINWAKATQKAARVINMNRWRIFEWLENQEVYYLHALYNNKRQLAFVNKQLKRYNKAQVLLEELMDGKMHRENPILVASKELLVTLFIESGQFDEAEKKQEQIVEEMSETFGYDSKKLITELERLAYIYQMSKHLGKRHHVKLRLLRYR